MEKEERDHVYRQLGHYHYQRFIDGHLDYEYRAPTFVRSPEEFENAIQQIHDQLLSEDITITVHRKVNYYNDILMFLIVNCSVQFKFPI